MEPAFDPAFESTLQARLSGLDDDRLPARLWQRDPTLWSADPARHPAIVGRLGWLGLGEAMASTIEPLRAFAAEVIAEGFAHAVLLGMGGSSLAPEVMRLVLGVRPGFLELTILDNTSPAAVAAVANSHDPARTLFIVSSKSGSTLEVASFERTFFAWAEAARGTKAGRAFVAITDPGTSLEKLARERGYRRVFAGVPDVGGRYSALSPFGLVPAALIGADLEALLSGARAEAKPLAEGRSAGDVPGVRLGAVLGELALSGRDKLTLLTDAPLAPLGAWIEQLIAESTGKDGRGVVPVIEEPPIDPALYAADRDFVAIGGRSSELSGRIQVLRRAGQPVFSWDGGAETLGAEFMRWEIATATASAILGVNAFDEPNVTEAKEATRAALESYRVAGRFADDPALASAGELEVRAPAAVAGALRPHLTRAADPEAWLGALLALARPGDYLAVLAYLVRTPDRHRRLQRLRERAGAIGRIATTLGYGPRYLHSTGQLHKGGPRSGLFLLITADPGPDRAIPDAWYGFATLQRAQAQGDYAALERHGHRLLHLHLGSDAERGLDALIAAVAPAGKVG